MMIEVQSQTEDWENRCMIFITQRFLFRRRIRRTLSLHPSSPRALFNQLLLAANQEQGDEALTILRKLLSFPQVYTALKVKEYFLRKKLFLQEELMPGLYTQACNSMLDLAKSTRSPLRYSVGFHWKVKVVPLIFHYSLCSFIRNIIETTTCCLRRPRFLSGTHKFW